MRDAIGLLYMEVVINYEWRLQLLIPYFSLGKMEGNFSEVFLYYTVCSAGTDIHQQ